MFFFKNDGTRRDDDETTPSARAEGRDARGEEGEGRRT